MTREEMAEAALLAFHETMSREYIPAVVEAAGVEVIHPDDPEAVRIAAIVYPERFKAVAHDDHFDFTFDPAAFDFDLPDIGDW